MEILTMESPIPTVSSPVPTACLNDSLEPSSKARLISKRVANQEETTSLDNILSLTNRFEDILGVTTSSDEAIGVEADVSNMETTISASPTPTLRIYKDHPKSQIIGPVDTPIQTKHKSKKVEEQSFIATIYQKTDPALLQFCLFTCFLSQVEPKKKVWTLVDCPKGVRPIGTKWVLKNKKNERGIVVRNKAMLVAQGHTQEEGIDYDEPPGFQDPAFPAKVYKVEKAIEFEALMHEKFQMSVMGKLNFFLGLQVLPKEDGIFLSQDKYIGDILKKFGYSDVRSSNTPMDKENPWGKDGTGKDVDLHLYRSMIGSLMYLTASRPDIMFVVCACARHQVTPKECHLHAVKRIFRYLKDRKSTTRGSQFLGRRLISWQCKKQTIVAISTTEAEYVVAASCCRQVLWIQNQLLDCREISVLNCKYWNGTSKYWGVLRMLMIGLRLIPLGEFNTDFHPMVDFIAASPLRARIAQSSTLPTIADEPASPMRDVSKREACPTKSGFIADQDRAAIAKSSTLAHDSAPRVTSPAADEGKVEILRLKERVQVLEDREDVAAKQSRDDAPIKGRSIIEGEAAAERISNDSEDIARVLTSMDAATVLAGGIDVPTGSGSIPIASPPATVISTGSEVGPTANLIVTSYSRRKGKEVMVESDTPKKQRLQEHIDAQVTRELEEQQEKEDIRMNEQIAKDAEVARIHAEEELQGMIDSLHRSNDTIAKYLQEYQDFSSELPLEKRIELIKSTEKANDLEAEEGILYGYDQKQLRVEGKRFQRKGLNLEQEHVKKQKSSDEAPEIEKSTEEITKEKMKEMMQLVPIEDVYVQALQVKHPITDWKVHTEGQRSYWKIIRKFPLPEGTSHCLKMNATIRRIEMPLPEVCTAIEEKKKKLTVKDRWQLH
nr:hypothetical protein [Tanacetum cinerariifolium]